MTHKIELGSSTKATIEPFFILSLPLVRNATCISDLMDRNFERKELKGGSIKSSKYSLEKLPELLVIQVRAFTYDKRAQKIVKQESYVAAEDNLKLKKDWIAPGMNVCSYSLIGG